jgi:hypothetical protein
MIWANKWRSLGRWMDRLPWWQQIVLLPPLTPLLLVAAACLCPWTTTFAAFILIVAYVPLVQSGVVVVDLSWYGALAGLGEAYVGLMLLGFFSVLQTVMESWMGQKPPSRIRASLRLWDREIDG